ncbi:MAG: Fe-S protein assembly co-chaperone HscB [Candidatus Binatia bacterium]
MRCWRCDHQHQATLFCPACEAIQLVSSQADYFRVLGIPQSPVVDESALTQRYYELSRQLHPDLYQTGTAQEKEASLKNTALLTRAYRTLRDAVQRGQYWLELNDEQLGKDNNRVPPKLAELVFDVQEKLAGAQEARVVGKNAEVQAELVQVRSELEQRLSCLRSDLDANFAQWEDLSARPTLLLALKRILSEIAYLRTLLRDVEKESEA